MLTIAQCLLRNDLVRYVSPVDNQTLDVRIIEQIDERKLDVTPAPITVQCAHRLADGSAGFGQAILESTNCNRHVFRMHQLEYRLRPSFRSCVANDSLQGRTGVTNRAVFIEDR